MKVLIEKELREHAQLAGGFLVLMLVGIARAMWDLSPAEDWQGVARASLLILPSVGGAAFLVTIGVLQTHGEKRRGSWTFLVHRPIARSQIVLAKAAAAALLFFAAIVLPVALGAAWWAWPGRVAGPAPLSMLLPVAVDLVSAVPYYAAGVVAGLWQPRFTVMRGLPLAIPVASSVLAHAVCDQAWQAVVVVLVATAWLGVVAWQLFDDRPSEALLATMTCAGLAALQLVVVAFMPIHPFERSDQSDPRRFTYFVAHDGTVGVATVTRQHVEAVSDLSGRAMSDGLADKELSHIEVRGARLTPSPPRAEPRGFRHAWRYERVAQPSDRYPHEWYFDRTERRFVAFSVSSGAMEGSLGPDGFLPQGGESFGTPVGRLDMATPVIVFSSGAYRVRWDDATIERLPLADDAEVIDVASLSHARGVALDVYRTRTHVEIVDGQKHVASLPIDIAWQSADLEVGIVDATGEFFVRCDSASTVTFFAASGDVSRRIALPPLAVARSPHARRALAPIAVVPPSLALAQMARAYVTRGVLVDAPAYTLRHLGLALAIALASAIGTLLLARRRRVWMAFLAFFAGPVGVALPFLFRADEGLTCPGCGASRDASAAPCPSCEALLDGFRPSDTRIIDPAFAPPP